MNPIYLIVQKDSQGLRSYLDRKGKWQARIFSCATNGTLTLTNPDRALELAQKLNAKALCVTLDGATVL